MKPRLALVGALLLSPLALGGCADAASPSASSSGSQGQSASSSASCPPADGSAQRRTSFSAAPPMCIDAARTYQATVVTDAGTVVVDLDAKRAPKTVNNFVTLARYHYYDGITFHRVIPGFMIQGGDPQGTGRGGPGYTIPDELPKAGDYAIGSVAMAKTSAPNSAGSQFFIVTGARGVALQPDYPLFGTVSSGMDVVKKIEADGSDDGTGAGVPTKVHSMTKVTVTEK